MVLGVGCRGSPAPLHDAYFGNSSGQFDVRIGESASCHLRQLLVTAHASFANETVWLGVGSSNGRSRLQARVARARASFCVPSSFALLGTEVSTERGGYRHIWSVAILAQALLFEIKRFYGSRASFVRNGLLLGVGFALIDLWNVDDFFGNHFYYPFQHQWPSRRFVTCRPSWPRSSWS